MLRSELGGDTGHDIKGQMQVQCSYQCLGKGLVISVRCRSPTAHIYTQPLGRLH